MAAAAAAAAARFFNNNYDKRIVNKASTQCKEQCQRKM